MTTPVILIAIALLIIFWAVGAYQRLVSQRLQCKAAFVQVDAQVKRRYELIPNLVETARGYMKDEREVLEAVITADNAAIAAQAQAGGNVFTPAAVARMAAAEDMLDAAWTYMLALSQQYSALQSDQNMKRFLEELADAENRIGFAREVYNDAASHYNAARAQFPSSVIAVVFGFTPVGVFQAGT